MQMIDKTLQELSRKADWLVLWLDFDREGENICFEVMERCLKVNRNLVVKRAKFSSVIPREIYQACENLIQPDKNKSDAAEARSELDLRVGAAFTRCQTLFLQKKIADLKELVISYGRRKSLPVDLQETGVVDSQIDRTLPISHAGICSR